MRKIYAGAAKPEAGGGGTPEVAKGSFNASTQMLTFKNSYLVEKVNSSIASQAQKDAVLQQLGDNDVVINMNIDRAEGLPVTMNAWLLSDDAETPIGAMLVSKTNPVTIKFLFTGDGGLMFIDWSAFAEYLSLQGTTITPEQAEEQYGAYVVDENVCTVSGTLGDFEVEFIEDAPVVEKYGATISNFLGDVDANGVLQAPSGEWSLNFSGVKVLRTDSLPTHFLYKDNGIKTVSFPDLETIYSVSSDNGIGYLAQYSSIERFNCPKLKNFQTASGVVGCNVFYAAFGYCPNFKGINSDNGILFPELEDMTNAVINMYFSTSYITFISFPKLKKISGWDYGRINMYFTGSASNNKVASINFPLLEELSGGSTNDYRQCSLVVSNMPSLETAVFPSLTKVYEHRAIDLSYCTSLTSVSFPALKSNSFGTNYGVTKPFHNMLQGVTGCTVHFPSNMQSVMENMSSVTAGFGGTNTTVLFDLPATE